eukprot:scaffold12688_cov49-Attheya_sp.AAC.1
MLMGTMMSRRLQACRGSGTVMIVTTVIALLSMKTVAAFGIGSPHTSIAPVRSFGLRPATSVTPSTTALPMAKSSSDRKRRKRKNAPKSASSSSNPAPVPAQQEKAEALPDFEEEPNVMAAAAEAEAMMAGELPDFDLGDDDEEADQQSKSPASVTKVDAGSMESFSQEMMATSKRDRSLDELLSDRSMDKFIKDDEDSAEIRGIDGVPDLEQIRKVMREGGSVSDIVSSTTPKTSSTSVPVVGMGKKRAKTEARQQAALQAKELAEIEAQANKSPLDQLLGINKDGKQRTAVDALEIGAWTGIYLLVAWEVYLNSPFFDRAATMIPVVYEFLL